MEKDERKPNRRTFLSKSIKGIAAGGLLGMVGRNALSYPLQGKQSDAKKNVIRRKLGKTGIQLPIVSMGVMNTLNPDLVKRAYEIGVRHFDTAAYYMRGRNEQTIGSVIKDLGIRDQVIIGTKIYIPHPQRGMDSDKVKETYLRTAEESLKRLQTDYVDILYSHSVNSLDWLNHPGIIEALQSLKKQGKARFIGFSTHNNMAECIRDAARSGLYDVILTMFNYSLWDDQGMTDALKKAYSKKIGLVAMKTQCIREGGHWRDLPDSQRRYYEGSMMQTAILKWVLRHPFITTAIPGVTAYQHMEEDFSVAFGLEYTPEEKKFLEDKNVTIAMGFCRQCGQCMAGCPNGVEIPTLMRTHMYASRYANFYAARDAFESIPEKRGITACRSCSRCMVTCASGIDVGKRIDELKILFV